VTRLASAQALRRHGPQGERWASALDRSDPLADAVAERIAADPATMGTLHRALSGTPAGRAGGSLPPELDALFASVTTLPPGVDHDAIARGGRLFFRTGAAGGLALGAGSLVGGYASPDGNKPLIRTRRLLDDVPRRLAETASFVVAVHSPGGILPGGEGWRLALHVRVMHAVVRRRLRLDPTWDPCWGLPLNQHDLGGTLLLFSIIWVEAVRRLGWPVTGAEAEDHVALWRVAGRWMGVDEELLPVNEADALASSALIAATERAPDDDARRLVRALLASGPPGRTRPVRVAFAEAIVRHVQGPALADPLGLGDGPAKHLIPLFTLPNGPLSWLGRRSARAEALLVSSGERYWRTTVDSGAPPP
jgi:hypothetical protein